MVDGIQGNAYGVHTAGDFTLDTNVSGQFSLNIEGNNAYEIYLAGAGKKTGGSETVNAANEVNVGTLTLVGADANNGAVKGSLAYGIYNTSGAWNKLSGTITFGDGTNAAVGSNTATEAYGIYNAGKLELAESVVVKANALKTDGATTSKAYALYNARNLTIGENSEISAGDATNNVNLSAKTSTDTLDVMLANNSVTTLQGTAGIGGMLLWVKMQSSILRERQRSLIQKLQILQLVQEAL